MIGSILDTLYESDYFGLILLVAIIFLIALFLIVLFMGKKDKKKREIEATKKLEQINESAFKEEGTAIGVEVATPNVEPILNNNASVVENTEVFNNNPVEPILEPINTDHSVTNTPASVVTENMPEEPVEPANMSEISSVENIPESIPDSLNVENISAPEINIQSEQLVEPVIEEPVEPVINIPEVEINIPPVDVEINPMNSNTSNEVLEQEKPVTPEVTIPEVTIPSVEVPTVDIPEVKEEVPQLEENTTPVLEPISVPDFNFDSIMENVSEVQEEPKIAVKPAPQVFSSVYAPKMEAEEEITPVISPAPSIEIPEVENIPVVGNNTNDDMYDFEMPALKKETDNNINEEIPTFNDYNLDNLSGETYNINK